MLLLKGHYSWQLHVVYSDEETTCNKSVTGVPVTYFLDSVRTWAILRYISVCAAHGYMQPTPQVQHLRNRSDRNNFTFCSQASVAAESYPPVVRDRPGHEAAVEALMPLQLPEILQAPKPYGPMNIVQIMTGKASLPSSFLLPYIGPSNGPDKSYTCKTTKPRKPYFLFSQP